MDNKDIRYVAHLDILGMSKIVNNDIDDAWGMLSDLVKIKNESNNSEINFLETKEIVKIRDKIHTVTFSDTIVLFTKGNTSTELRCIIILLSKIFHKALFKCVPIRAGLAVGKFYFNIEKSMYVGPALIDAYRIGEGAQWLGISLASSVHDKALNLNLKTGGSDVVINWDIPMKGKTLNSYVINWPALSAHDLTINHPITVDQFYEAFRDSFGNYDNLSSDVKIKYINTVNFMNYQLDKHKKPNKLIQREF